MKYFVKTAKAESKSQQRFMGMVHAYQKGELSEKSVTPQIREAAKSMTYKETKTMAETKHKGLPEKVANVKNFFSKPILAKIKTRNALQKSISKRSMTASSGVESARTTDLIKKNMELKGLIF